MAAFNTTVGHPTTIRRQYMPLATIYYRHHEQRINIPRRQLSDNQEDAQTVKNQTMRHVSLSVIVI